MDFNLTQEQLQIREEIRKVCKEFPDAYWREIDGKKEYPEAFVRKLSELGWLAALIPEDYGGTGLGITEASIILEEINHSGGVATACHAQMYTMGTLLRHGSEEQKRRYLPTIAAGELRLQAFGVTEPTVGSNTTPFDEVERKTDGLSVFLVDMKAAGSRLTVRPIATMMNHGTTEVFLDDVEVPADALVGEEGAGFRHILDGMNAERILIAAECVGDGRWFVEKATAYAC